MSDARRVDGWAAWNPTDKRWCNGIFWRDGEQRGGSLIPEGCELKPVCLVSPELLDWIEKFKLYIECVQRDRNLVEFLGDNRHSPPNTLEEEYLLDLLNKILPAQEGGIDGK